jgi:hypothetical protein
MPKVRDILIHVDVETAAAKRKCHHKPKKHSIAKGEPCLVVRGGPYNASKNYCRQCASEILRHLDDRVREILNSLGSNAPP